MIDEKGNFVKPKGLSSVDTNSVVASRGKNVNIYMLTYKYICIYILLKADDISTTASVIKPTVGRKATKSTKQPASTAIYQV